MRAIRVESIIFTREEHGIPEVGILIAEGYGPIIDMDGKIVENVWLWKPTMRDVMTVMDESPFTFRT